MRKENFVIRKVGCLWVMEVIAFPGEPFVVTAPSRTMLEDLKHFCLIHNTNSLADLYAEFSDSFVFVR